MNLGMLLADLEAVSVGYASRNGIDRTDEWLVLKLNEEVGELTQAFLARAGQARDKGLSSDAIGAGFRAEVADVFAQVLLIAHRFGVDVLKEVDEKWIVLADRWRSVDLELPPS